MRKQARRLWTGDWQRGAETAPADTFVITPDEGPEVEPAPESARNSRRHILTGVAIATVVALALAISSGGQENRLSAVPRSLPRIQQVPPLQLPQQTPPQAGVPGGGFGGADLSGGDAQKAATAATGKYPGQIERVTAGPSGDGYIVHVIQEDGNEVHVFVSPDFDVEGSDAGRGPGGPGGGWSPYAPAPQGGSGNSS